MGNIVTTQVQLCHRKFASKQQKVVVCGLDHFLVLQASEMFALLSKRLVLVGKGPSMVYSQNFNRGYKKSPEPEWGFTEEDDHPIEDIKFPFMNESMRVEMYNKFRNEPEVWTIKKISNHYGPSLDRVKGIVYLMTAREEKIKENGFEYNPDTAQPKIPTKWQQLYDAHVADKTLSVGVLAEQCEMVGEEAEIKNILTRMEQHYSRFDNLMYDQEDMAETVMSLVDEGMKPGFHETPVQNADQSLTRYFPKLLGESNILFSCCVCPISMCF